jgi:TDG/mug DNA glycosylase family protein
MANSGRHRVEGLTREYEPGLDVIFCGINPASTAAEAGHNFSSASNRFWRVLHLAGFTQTQLAPQNEHRLLDYHCGITAVVRRSTARASEVSLREFKRARSQFEAKMRHYAPRYVALLGKRTLSAMLGQPKIDWGRQSTGLAGSHSWIPPNPSSLNRTFALDALVRSYAELRDAMLEGGSGPASGKLRANLTRRQSPVGVFLWPPVSPRMSAE